jgi:hypothetical protein
LRKLRRLNQMKNLMKNKMCRTMKLVEYDD